MNEERRRKLIYVGYEKQLKEYHRKHAWWVLINSKGLDVFK